MSVDKSSKTRRKFDASFKEDVLKMVASGRPVSDVVQVLGLSASLIHRWNRNSRSSFSASSSTGNSYSNPEAAELERLKAELRRTEMERDILKKLP